MHSNYQVDMKQAANMGQDDNNGWVKKLPSILRSFGAIAVLCSLYSFLMRGWEGSDDLVRYCMLLGHTGLLTVIGLGSGHILKEGKSARLLIMLSMISVVANFAILGALIFFEMAAVNTANYPYYMVWGADNLPGVLMAGFASFVLLVPVVFIGFRVLSRGMSHKMSILFLLSNIALLVPLRDPVLVAMMAAVLGSYTLFFNITTTRQKTEAKTFEGMFALLLQFLPVMTLLVRNIWLYQADIILFASASLMGFIALRQCSLMMKKTSLARVLGELVSMMLAITTGAGACLTMDMAGVNASLAMILGTVIAAMMCYEISLRAASGVGLYRIISSLVLVAGLLMNFEINQGVVSSMMLLLAGIMMISMSYSLKQRALLIGGSLLLIVGLFDQFIHVFKVFDFSYWLASAILGVLAILFASLIEVKGRSIKHALISYKIRYAQWSY